MGDAAEFLYYALLKHGKIITVILAVILFIMVFIYAQNWQMGFKEITSNSLKTCSDNTDCFYWCNECVSIASTNVCKSEYHPCKCVNGLCQES
jgi:type IV secretory pathway VirB3-like protein